MRCGQLGNFNGETDTTWKTSSKYQKGKIWYQKWKIHLKGFTATRQRTGAGQGNTQGGTASIKPKHAEEEKDRAEKHGAPDRAMSGCQPWVSLRWQEGRGNRADRCSERLWLRICRTAESYQPTKARWLQTGSSTQKNPPVHIRVKMLKMKSKILKFSTLGWGEHFI